MPAWPSKSTTEGYDPKMPSVSEGASSPSSHTGDYPTKVGFGHEWTPNSASPERVSHSVPDSSLPGGKFPGADLPWTGGDSQKRKGGNNF